MRAGVLGVCAFLLAAVAAAQTYNYLDYRMINNAQDPFPYWVNDVQRGGLSKSQVEGATQAAFQSWDDVSCASTAFIYKGDVSSNPAIIDGEDPSDTYNVSTTLVSSASDGLYDYALGGGVAISGSVALTYAGTLYQCDIYLNNVPTVNDADPNASFIPNWTTGTPTAADALDVQTFVAHEVGHCQGLGHTPNPEATDIMRPDLTFGVQIHTPSAADQGALCYAYPVDGRQGSPCPPASCNTGLACVTTQRADGGTFPPICAQGCTPGDVNSTCPLPYGCAPSSQVPGYTGACVPFDGNQTQVGKACGDQVDCGSALGVCENAGTFPSGADAWPGGYCVQDCLNNSCPAESACTSFTDGSKLCLKTCRVGSGDCRDGYVCTQTNAAASPICVAQCHGNSDCATGYQCRTCDGVCLAVQNPNATIGTACTQDAQCGFGETCFLNGASTGVCTQSCATSCGACPGGTTCHPAGTNGDLICLRDCTPGSCGAGEQCADTSTGKGCLPGCTSNAQCPVGDVCNAGECVVASVPDAGCGGCTVDAGTPPLKSDAGTGPGPSSDGAFGCEAAPGSASWVGLWPLLLALGWLTQRRRRTWRSR